VKHIFTIIYFAGMIAEIILRAPYDRRRRAIPKVDQRIAGVERGLFAGISLGMFGLPLIYGLTTRLDGANYPWSIKARSRMGAIGAALLGAAVWIFWRAHHDLGTNWSPSLEINKSQTLVTNGIYRAIRHPMYASQMVWGIAQALLLHNWIAGLAGLASFLPLYFLRVPREERMMLDHFGDDYRAYSEQTGRILPRLRHDR
jgi:protein-S-isoprenylcysteine O-methyltransferase Ste14